MSSFPADPETMSSDLYPCFLGAYGENNDVLERLVVEFLRDHVYWRRNFHPEDPPPIPTFADQSPDYQAFVARMRSELHHLSAALKRSVPFYSPRYIGHMVSDLLLPGLIAQVVTLPYNPNNVVEEAAPVTLDLELSAGLQLAAMFGYATDEDAPNCAFGHLTSGGTVANYEALRMQLATRFYPLAARAAAERTGHAFRAMLPNGRALTKADDWDLANLTLDQAVALYETLHEELHGMEDRGRAAHLKEAIEAERLETLGLIEFFNRHDSIGTPCLMVPVTAHYSWAKAMKVLGLGDGNLIEVPEQRMRMDADALESLLARAAERRRPVLGVVGVLGTTEFGTMDPVDAIVDARDRWAERGLGFAVHVDAAWGGYLTTLFRRPDGSLRPRADIKADGFRYFPSNEVYDTFAALSRADSITVDPHKLGYIPYGAGAFVCRDHRLMLLTALDAPYLFEPAGQDDRCGYRQTFRGLGRFILEGSKSGAAAAAVYVTHRVLPLDHQNFGRIPQATVQATEYFFDRARRLAEDLADVAVVTIPFEPDSNLICLAVNPRGNRRLARMNAFGRRLYAELKVDIKRPLQVREFFGSSTVVSRRALGADEAGRVCRELGIDPATLTDEPDDPEVAASGIFLLRHTLMNPWLDDEVNDINYIDLYCEFLASLIRKEVARWSVTD